MSDSPQYPGAVEPERQAFVQSLGLRLNVVEWGDPAAPPVLLCHGMWDHARGFATLAPLLADRFRVLALDARGHGESDWGDTYSWETDVLDIVNVGRWLGRPMHLVGHSKGGGQVSDAARCLGDQVRSLVNIDGFGPPPFTEENEATPARCAEFLDARRALATRNGWRPYASLDELIARRSSQNPRLSQQWLRYFAFHAARQSDDGWRWKADPQMMHDFGPWRPDWIGPSYAYLHVPMLAIVGSEADTWGPLPEPILDERLRHVRDLERARVAGAGHFVHMEHPSETAALLLDFLEP